MSDMDGALMPGETVVHRGRLHWSVFHWAILWGVLALAALATATGLEIPILLAAAALFGLLAIIAGLSELARYLSAELTVTNRRLILQRGLLRRQTSDLPLPKIEAVRVEQSLWPRLLDYGTLIVSGTGGVLEQFHRLDDPMSFRRTVQQYLPSMR